MAIAIDLTGCVFGRLTVLSEADRGPACAGNKYGKRRWQCECSCGEQIVVYGNNLRTGKSSSCGCLQKERTIRSNTTHGHSAAPEYLVWKGMTQRCTNAASPAYRHYGGRGITICRRWQGQNGFSNFLADMGPRPAGLTLERTDNERGYSPANCRWATRAVQARNTRNSVLVPVDGKNRNLSEWLPRLDISKTQYYRLRKRGRSHAEIISEHVKK